MLHGINRFQVQQHQVSGIQCFEHRFRCYGSRSIQRGMDPLFLAKQEETTHELRLQQRFASCYRNSSFRDKAFIPEHFVEQLLRRKKVLASAFDIPGIRVMAIETSQRAPLHEHHEPYSRAVHRAEAL